MLFSAQAVYVYEKGLHSHGAYASDDSRILRKIKGSVA
jgi:hypothetical protein